MGNTKITDTSLFDEAGNLNQKEMMPIISFNAIKLKKIHLKTRNHARQNISSISNHTYQKDKSFKENERSIFSPNSVWYGHSRDILDTSNNSKIGNIVTSSKIKVTDKPKNKFSLILKSKNLFTNIRPILKVDKAQSINKDNQPKISSIKAKKIDMPALANLKKAKIVNNLLTKNKKVIQTKAPSTEKRNLLKPYIDFEANINNNNSFVNTANFSSLHERKDAHRFTFKVNDEDIKVIEQIYDTGISPETKKREESNANFEEFKLEISKILNQQLDKIEPESKKDIITFRKDQEMIAEIKIDKPIQYFKPMLSKYKLNTCQNQSKYSRLSLKSVKIPDKLEGIFPLKPIPIKEVEKAVKVKPKSIVLLDKYYIKGPPLHKKFQSNESINVCQEKVANIMNKTHDILPLTSYNSGVCETSANITNESVRRVSESPKLMLRHPVYGRFFD